MVGDWRAGLSPRGRVASSPVPGWQPPQARLKGQVPNGPGYERLVNSGCTRPAQSQSGAIFFHLNDHCVVFKSARQFWKNVTGRYEKYASDHANKLAYLLFFK